MLYKWAHPYEWLTERIKNEQDIVEVKSICYELAKGLDGDSIQDLFQEEMDRDGYFKPLE